MAQISDSEDNGNELFYYRQPSKTYNNNGIYISGNIDGLDAVRQSVRHILATERYAYPIYDDNYGVELEQYIGQDIGFITAGIEQTLKDALLQDDRIKDVTVTDIEKSRDSESTCNIKIRVQTVYGEYMEDLNV